MKKLYFLLSMLILSSTFAVARQPRQGYRGFIDYTLDGTSFVYDAVGRVSAWFNGVSTSHGYQFSRNLFLGGGLMVEYNSSCDKFTAPIFGDFRWDEKIQQYTPFVDVKLGYNMADGGGLYVNPTVGYRFNWGFKAGINVGVGFAVRGASTDVYDVADNNGQASLVHLGKKSNYKCMFSVRLGIDF